MKNRALTIYIILSILFDLLLIGWNTFIGYFTLEAPTPIGMLKLVGPTVVAFFIGWPIRFLLYKKDLLNEITLSLTYILFYASAIIMPLVTAGAQSDALFYVMFQILGSVTAITLFGLVPADYADFTKEQ